MKNAGLVRWTGEALTLRVLAAVGIILTLTSTMGGCGIEHNDEYENADNSALACDNGEAWIDEQCKFTDCAGIILKKNGELVWISKDNEKWKCDECQWNAKDTNKYIDMKWSNNLDSLHISQKTYLKNREHAYPYKISDKHITIENFWGDSCDWKLIKIKNVKYYKPPRY